MLAQGERCITGLWAPLVFLVVLIVSCTASPSVSPTESSKTADPSRNPAPATATEIERFNTPAPSLTPNPADRLPPQGLYESCLPDEIDCLDRLAEMGRRGFRIVLNDGLRFANTQQSILEYADRAYSLGIQVILPVKYSPEWDNDPLYLVRKFPELANACHSKDNKGFLACYIRILKEHPAFWGYYIADEVHPEYAAGLFDYAEYIKELDPAHPRLIVVEGSNDPMEVFFTFHSYMAASVDVLGVDYYPYGYRETFGNLSRSTGASARMGQYWANQSGLKYVMVLQAYRMTQYYGLFDPLCMPWPFCATFPTFDQMKSQRDQALLNAQPDFLLWFSYPDILRSDQPAKHWEDLVKAAFSTPPDRPSTPSPAPAPQTCPSGWTCQDIGNPQIEGTQSLQNGTWQVQASGWDIWSTYYEKADQFRFIWRELPAEGELSARVVEQSKVDPWAKTGLMLRATIDPVSPYYAIYVTPSAGVRVQYRADFDQDPVDLVSIQGKEPVWIKILRKDTSFQAATSDDGLSWNLIPGSTAVMVNLGDSLMAGLAVTSRNENKLTTAVYEQVKLTGPGN